MSNQFVDCGSFQNTEFKWTHSANWLLINSYLDMKNEFRTTNRKKELWIKIANKFRESGYEIPYELLDKKFRNLKATYYQVKERKRNSSNKQIKWEYFKVFEDLLSDEDTAIHTAAPLALETSVSEDPRLVNFRSSVYVPSNTEFKWTHSANWLLINSYLDMKNEFRTTNRKKELWIKIANKFRESGYEIPYELLDKKFRNLKATYYQVKERKRNSSNKQIKWEYFKVFEDLLSDEDTAIHTAAPLALETSVSEDPRLVNFRSSVYVPSDSRKRKRTPSKSKSHKLVNIEPELDAIDDDIMDDSKSNINGFKEELAPIDDTILEDSQDGTFEDDDEEYEDDVSGNYDIPSFSKKINLSNLEAKKLQAETRYFHKKADYFEKQTMCIDIQRKLMIMQAHKLKLEIERMKSDKKIETFTT